MRTISATTVISEDRKLVLQLPSDVSLGEHRVVVMLDDPDEVLGEAEADQETSTRWDNGVLVYDGEVGGPLESVIKDSREERMQQILAGYWP